MIPVSFPVADSKIGDVPVSRQRGIVLTRWQMSWCELWDVIRTRKVWIFFKGETMPPTLVSGNTEFEFDE
jgi:hypothetical protein